MKVPEDNSSLKSGNLELRVSYQEDRYVHEFLDILEGTLLMQSSEGDETNFWPPSPAFQQCSVEEYVPGNKQIFLVGMAGKSHYSCSIEAIEFGFVFDVACRIKEEAGFLGSTYKLAHDKQLRLEKKSHFISGRLPSGKLELCSLELPNSPEIRTFCQVNGDFGVQLVPPDEIQYPETFRWKYQVRYISDKD